MYSKIKLSSNKNEYSTAAVTQELRTNKSDRASDKCDSRNFSTTTSDTSSLKCPHRFPDMCKRSADCR
ncbi:hypothetical protein X777_10991 [Ooceraea biroi]|uniref:Uncharacterized protein n=1 Tax=Ooceraea biroi TaxID=2015173 RepID=A0A026W3I3_OOCBI|nr:hypothetical protein X777_10991 [Ooceraea biroi]